MGCKQCSSLASLEPGRDGRARASFWVGLGLALPNGPHLASLEPRPDGRARVSLWVGPGLAYLVRSTGCKRFRDFLHIHDAGTPDKTMPCYSTVFRLLFDPFEA